jgi:hypothetical protein
MGCARNQVSQVRPCVLMCATRHPSTLNECQADRASVGANQQCLDESLQAGMGGIDEVDGVVSNRLEHWKDRAL